MFNFKFLHNIYNDGKEFQYKFFYNDEALIRKRFKKQLKRDVDLENPIKYNDKLQWLKLNWYDPHATICADKFKVRQIVTEKIGSEYLPELLGVYDTVEEINIDELPNSFVLKTTHGSGFNIICKDKKKMDWKKNFKLLRKWLKINYFWQSREWVYKSINPKIICEKFLEQNHNEEIYDYRFFCFDGDVKIICVDFHITNKKRTRRNIYDLNWNLLDAEISYPKNLSTVLEKPSKLDEMIFLSQQLSTGFPHARVDFYYYKNKITFGEITFFHQSGWGKINPESFEITLGNWLKLPKTNI